MYVYYSACAAAMIVIKGLRIWASSQLARAKWLTLDILSGHLKLLKTDVMCVVMIDITTTPKFYYLGFL